MTTTTLTETLEARNAVYQELLNCYADGTTTSNSFRTLVKGLEDLNARLVELGYVG
jgi:hypothetical protein